MIDKKLLLAYLRGWSKHRNLLIVALAGGLITRIQNGEFDAKNTEGGAKNASH